MNITVFGSGGWGTAIAMLLSGNGHNVTLWSAFENEAASLIATRQNMRLKGVIVPEDIHITHVLEDAAATAELAVIATPSFAVRETAERLRGMLRLGCVVVCASKGIEEKTSRLFTDILSETLGGETPIAALSGPTHAEEVARKVPTACVAASNDLGIAQSVQDLFMNDYFRVYTSTDVIGVELGAALKNVIALCAGISEGLGFGDNTIAMLATRGLAEIANLCVALGGKKETIAGLAGLGDLIVTCTSRHSRNRAAGVLIGQGSSVSHAMEEVGAVVEGYFAARAAHDMSEKCGIVMPLCREAYRVLHEDKDPMEALQELMGRSKKSEWASGEETWVTR